MSPSTISQRVQWFEPVRAALAGTAAYRLALLVGVGVLAFGLWSTGLLVDADWPRLREAGWFALVMLVAAWIVARTTRLAFAAALIAILLALHIGMVGLAAVGAVLLVALAALAVGSGLVPSGARARPWLALVAGLGCLAAAVGWLLPYGLHRWPVYLAAGLVLMAWRRQAIAALVGELRAGWRIPRQGLGWEGALGVVVIAYCAMSAWLPTAQFDDLAYHLGLPAQVAALGHYRFDVQGQVWSAAPWAADVLQAIVQVLAREEGRGALNSLWLLIDLSLLWSLFDRFEVPLRWRWLGLALFASQPLVHALLQSMQTELAMSAVVLAIAVVVVDSTRGDHARARLPLVGVLIGFALALKLVGLLFVLPLAIWFGLRTGWPGLRALVGAGALAFVVGGSSYVYCAWLTGNPVLPLFNDVFASPYFPLERFADTHYMGLLDWSAPYDLVLHTSRFHEGTDGVAGFQWLALLGVVLLGLARRELWPLTLVGLLAVVVLFVQMQHLRYLFPALALLSVAAIAVSHAAGATWTTRSALLVLTGLNLVFLGGGMWTLRESPLSWALRSGALLETPYLREVAPERLLVRYLREAYGDNLMVLFLESDFPYAAELAGRGLADVWYDPSTAQAAREARDDESGAHYAALFEALGVTHVVVRHDSVSAALSAALSRAAQFESREAQVDLYRIERAPLVLEGAPKDRSTLSHQVLDLSAAAPYDTPLWARFSATLACAPTSGAIAARLLSQVGLAKPQRALDYQLCPSSGTLRVQGEGRMRQTERVILRLEPGGAPVRAQFALHGVEVVVRKDLTTMRDLSRRLRP
jgi:hypothetical protein